MSVVPTGISSQTLSTISGVHSAPPFGNASSTTMKAAYYCTEKSIECWMNPPSMTYIAWITVVANETVTAGTVYHITSNGTNTTRYSTSHNIPPTPVLASVTTTDSAGVAVTTMSVGSSHMAVTYPSSWVNYDDYYVKMTKAPNASDCRSTFTIDLPSSPVYDGDLAAGALGNIAIPTTNPNNTNGMGYIATMATRNLYW